MSEALLKQRRQHPARDAALKSIQCVQNGDREGWLSLWRPDAFIEDPVGVSLMDPEGKGHRGIAEIADFFTIILSPRVTSAFISAKASPAVWSAAMSAPSPPGSRMGVSAAVNW